jgi:hypothetical protein
MPAYQKAQTYTDLRWGIMPTAMLIGGAIVEARARGTCAVAVADPGRLAEQVPNPEDLPGLVRSLAGQAIADLLGQRGLQAADAAQFTVVDPAVLQALHDALAPRLAQVGLELKALCIDAIECM